MSAVNRFLVFQALAKIRRENLTAKEAAETIGLTRQMIANYGHSSDYRLHAKTSRLLRLYLSRPDQIKAPVKVRRSIKMMGPLNPAWRGGTSQYPNYSPVLEKVRAERFAATNGLCEKCGKEAQVIHHKNLNKSDHRADNLMPLCYKCHWRIHHLPEEISA